MQFQPIATGTKDDLLSAFDAWGLDPAARPAPPRKGRAVFVAFPDGRTCFRITKTQSRPDVYLVERNVTDTAA
jgi:hypothetical protein